MKKFIFLFTVLAVVSATVSCTREEVHGGVVPVSEGEPVTLRVGISAAQTRVAESVKISEEEVNSLQVFVFNEDGWLERSAYTNDTSYVEISCFAGHKNVVAVVNAPEEIDWGETPTLADLDALTTRLTENSLSKFFMYGCAAADIPGDEVVNVVVSRRVARVVLRSVTNEISSSSAVGTLSLNAVFLLNVVGDDDYGRSGTHTISEWYNLSALDDADLSLSPYDFLYDTIDDYSGKSGATYSNKHLFYCYPNWTDQPTRLVVEADLNGRTWYYPITIDTVEPNCSYEVDLTITGAGAASPDTDPQIADFNFKISIKEWEVIGLGDEGKVTI